MFPFKIKERFKPDKDIFMMWFKILVACLPCILIVLFLVGCTNKTNEPKEKEESKESSGELILTNDDEDRPDRENIINIKLDNNSNDVISPIGKIIKEKVYKDFDINDYVVTKSQSEVEDENGVREVTDIYDYGFVLGGATTTIGFTVFVENNVVTRIYNNLNGYDVTKLKNSDKEKEIILKIKNFGEEKKERIKSEIIKTYKNVELTDEYIIYDIKKDYLFYSVGMLGTDPGIGSQWFDYYEQEIK